MGGVTTTLFICEDIMTALTLHNEVSNLLKLKVVTDISAVAFNEKLVLNLINKAARHINRRFISPYTVDTVDLSIVVGTQEYSLPTDILGYHLFNIWYYDSTLTIPRPTGIIDIIEYTDYIKAPIQARRGVNQYAGGNERATSQIQAYIFDNKLVFTQVPTVVHTLKLTYKKQITPMNSNDDETGLEAIWDDAIVYKAVFDYLLKEGDDTRSDYAALYADEIISIQKMIQTKDMGTKYEVTEMKWSGTW